MTDVTLGIAAAKLGCCHLLSESTWLLFFPCHNRALQTSSSFAPIASSFLWCFVFQKNLVVTQHQHSAVRVDIWHGHVLPLTGGGEHGQMLCITSGDLLQHS